MRYGRSKLGTTIGYLWETQTKTAKIDYFTKYLSSPTFFEITTSKLQKVFLDIFRKIMLERSFCFIEIFF